VGLQIQECYVQYINQQMYSTKYNKVQIIIYNSWELYNKMCGMSVIK